MPSGAFFFLHEIHTRVSGTTLGMTRAKVEQLWACGTPLGITAKVKSGTMERAVAVAVPGLVPSKMSSKIPKTLYLYILHT